jgi:hypothetical protein
VALVSALVAIVVPFVFGKRAQKKELEEKLEDPRPASNDWDYSDSPASARPARRSAGPSRDRS